MAVLKERARLPEVSLSATHLPLAGGNGGLWSLPHATHDIRETTGYAEQSSDASWTADMVARHLPPAQLPKLLLVWSEGYICQLLQGSTAITAMIHLVACILLLAAHKGNKPSAV